MNLYINIFFLLILLSCIALYLSRSTLISILWSILIYLMVACIYILLGAEFLGVALIIVYVGAIAILFLFVVMMLNLRVVESYSRIITYIPTTLAIGLISGFLLSSHLMSRGNLKKYKILMGFPAKMEKTQEAVRLISPSWVERSTVDWVAHTSNKTNIHYIGEALYNHYFVLVIIAAILSLTAMVGSISLTLADKDESPINISVNYILKPNTIPFYYFQIKTIFGNINLIADRGKNKAWYV